VCHRLVALAVLLVTAGIVSASPTHAQQRPLPPGHPPTGGSTAPSIPSPPPSSGTGAQALTWTVPSGWVSETPSSSMRRAQYRITGPGGPAECVVFYFGPGQGGDARSNADRWAGQFQKPDGGAPAAKTREIKVGDVPVTLVDVAGTYVGGMGGGPAGPPKPDHALLGAIAEGPDAMWFFRATGPRATLETQRAAFEGMIRSIKRGR
jgi:hypothetical protein